MWALPFARNRPEWASRWLEKLEAGNVTGVAQRQKASVEEALQHIEVSRIPHLTEIYALFDVRAAVDTSSLASRGMFTGWMLSLC